LPARWAHAYSALSSVSGLIATVAMKMITPQAWRRHRGARTTQLRVRKSLVRPHVRQDMLRARAATASPPHAS
ncbi:MAG: hypothetical protein E6575_07740, partial [Bradyrhizobium sp.]|nr:hypothetical protein [Bradyrhizobium sp.]